MGLSRRQFLYGIAGAGAALGAAPGCLTNAQAPLAGEMIGEAARRGHLLRDGPPAAATSFEPLDVLIIGAGVSGLSAGWRLQREGFTRYEIFELSDSPGGNATWGDGPLSPHPWGAHYLPAPPPEARLARLFLEELGVLTGYDEAGRPQFDERSSCFAPEERIFYKGDWYPGLYLRAGASDDDLRQWAAFEAEIERWRYRRGRDGRRAFAIPIDSSSQDPELLALDRVPLDRWLDALGFTSPRLRWMVDYACRDDYCARPHQVSAWVGLHYFASRVLVADPTRDAPGPTLTWPEGNGFLARALAAPQLDRLRGGRLVFDLEPTPQGVKVSSLDVATGEVTGVLAAQVVCCAPLFVAARMLRGRQAAAPSALSALVWGPWLVANLWLDERPQGLGTPSAWDNVLYDGVGVGYVVANHQRAEYSGPSVITYYRPMVDDDPLPARRKLIETPWRGWVDEILRDLRPAHPDLRRGLSRVDVMGWGHGMLRPSPGWLWGPRLQWQASAGAVHFAHTDYALPLFEEAQHQGVRAAEAALRGLGQDVLTLCPEEPA